MKRARTGFLVAVLALAGCPESETTDSGAGTADLQSDGPVQDVAGVDQQVTSPDQQVTKQDQQVIKPDQQVIKPDQKVFMDTAAPPVDGSTTCLPEGGKFTNANTKGKCCGKLVPVSAKIPDGKGGCLSPNCPCYVCTNCGDNTCGKGENSCNCPKDCKASSPKASLSGEKWYQGNVKCKSATIKLSAATGSITATLSQISATGVPGTCQGHKATVSASASTLKLDITKTGGGACWTACWDFVVQITGLTAGSYTVNYQKLSAKVTVP